jgi:hypothetical protein
MKPPDPSPSHLKTQIDPGSHVGQVRPGASVAASVAASVVAASAADESSPQAAANMTMRAKNFSMRGSCFVAGRVVHDLCPGLRARNLDTL